ncbi:50S ribosomal protein L16 [Morus notabilis]|uniref:50S ribosomal protein L16 n=1 Tax=Morus notabilis TaxID=981085 RepID=W9RPB5_9ROSA|nr:uncharacterized protein LOC21387379 [Morus notabilis]EXB84823.1 50S ribosomal protein L16 [Morus notabilis]
MAALTRLFRTTTTTLSSLARSFASKPSNQMGYPKHHKGRIHGICHKGDRISFGSFALQALEPAWITARQIEAGRRAITKIARTGGKLWVRVFPDKPVTGKPAGVRMGRGKGGVEYMVAVVKPGRVLYEVGGVAESVAKKAIAVAASKMHVRTRFIAERGSASSS